MLEEILACDNLSKQYGKTQAVNQLQLKLRHNTISGLLGRNGAGKTTLLEMISGGILPDSGHITKGGTRLKPGQQPSDFCFVREKNYFYGGSRIMEILDYASSFHINWDWDYARDLIKKFKLNGSTKMRQLSRGSESLVGNIIGLASRASLTVYDEPVLGLDVLMRERFYKELVEDYAENPRTILISTHLIDEIAKIIERLYIMEAGRIIVDDDCDIIRSQSYLLKGSEEAIRKFTLNKKIIYEETFGKGMLAAVFDKIDLEEKQQANGMGIAIDELPLQKLFVYLSEGEMNIV